LSKLISMIGKTRLPRLAGGAFLATAATLVLAIGAIPMRGQGSSPPASGASADDSAGQVPAVAGIPVPLPRGKKLVLTDGSFQVVREYQREGDRVRYYSLERSAWEEIPATLVDWPATQKAEADQQAQQDELARKVKEAATAALAKEIDVDASLQIKPGLFLPDKKGFFVLDGNQITVMDLSKTETHTDKGRAVEKALSGVSIIPTKQNVEILGKRAMLRVHSSEPEFYFRPDDGREPQLSLMRVEVKGDNRAMMTTSTNIVGTQSYKRAEIPMTPWDAARGVYRFTVDQPLPQGEYAILEMLQDGGVANFVWDFGVDAQSTGGKPKKP
jgi:hypothetical protein